jgi:hypothetical protein
MAMADGFSRASGRLVACNVHVAPGLGNAMGPCSMRGSRSFEEMGGSEFEEPAAPLRCRPEIFGNCPRLNPRLNANFSLGTF